MNKKHCGKNRLSLPTVGKYVCECEFAWNSCVEWAHFFSFAFLHFTFCNNAACMAKSVTFLSIPSSFSFTLFHTYTHAHPHTRTHAHTNWSQLDSKSLNRNAFTHFITLHKKTTSCCMYYKYTWISISWTLWNSLGILIYRQTVYQSQ